MHRCEVFGNLLGGPDAVSRCVAELYLMRTVASCLSNLSCSTWPYLQFKVRDMAMADFGRLEIGE